MVRTSALLRGSGIGRGRADEVVNVKTAKQIGVTIAANGLAMADKVIK